MVPSCNAGKRGQERLTLASAVDLRLFGPRVRGENQKSPHWVCHRHLAMVGFFLLLVRQNRHHMSVWSGFFPCHKEIKGVFQTLLQATWMNLPKVGGQPTRMYQVRQWACNRHFAHGRTSALQYRLKSSTRVTLSSLLGLLLDHGGKEEPLPASTRFVSESSAL